MRSIFHNHISATDIADHVGHFILNFDLLKIFFRSLDCFFKIRIKVLYNRFPVNSSLADTVEQALHVCREMFIHDRWERFLHDLIYHFAEFCHVNVLIFLYNIASCKNRCNGRGIGTRTSDSKFL